MILQHIVHGQWTAEVIRRKIIALKLKQYSRVDGGKVMSETPKGCPFCGGKPKVYDILRRYVDDEPGVPPRKRWKVMCGARVDCCAILNDYDSPQEAIAAWNRRAQ